VKRHLGEFDNEISGCFHIHMRSFLEGKEEDNKQRNRVLKKENFKKNKHITN